MEYIFKVSFSMEHSFVVSIACEKISSMLSIRKASILKCVEILYMNIKIQHVLLYNNNNNNLQRK